MSHLDHFIDSPLTTVTRCAEFGKPASSTWAITRLSKLRTASSTLKPVAALVSKYTSLQQAPPHTSGRHQTREPAERKNRCSHALPTDCSWRSRRRVIQHTEYSSPVAMDGYKTVDRRIHRGFGEAVTRRLPIYSTRSKSAGTMRNGLLQTVLQNSPSK